MTNKNKHDRQRGTKLIVKFVERESKLEAEREGEREGERERVHVERVEVMQQGLKRDDVEAVILKRVKVRDKDNSIIKKMVI